MIVNRDGLADVLGLSPQTITEYVKQGLPVLSTGRGRNGHKYDTADCIAWVNAHGKSDVAEGDIIEMLEIEKVRLTRANADKAELERDALAGSLVSAAEVRKQAFEATRKARQMLMSLPDRTAAILANTKTEHETRQLLITEIHHICEELANANGYTDEDLS